MQTAQAITPDGDYARARAELLAAEIALKDQREQVAELRRSLPAVPLDTDYEFDEGPADLSNASSGNVVRTRLSDLFADGKDDLIVVHFMYGPADDAPCPMCTMWADGYNAVAHHLADKANVVLVAKTGIGKLRDVARARGWTGLRLLSSRNSSFNADYGVEGDDGKAQFPGVSVFTRGPDGRVSHFYTGNAIMAPDEYRGIDLMSPVWNLFDLLPGGRGDWMPKLDYTSG